MGGQPSVVLARTPSSPSIARRRRPWVARSPSPSECPRPLFLQKDLVDVFRFELYRLIRVIRTGGSAPPGRLPKLSSVKPGDRTRFLALVRLHSR
ncbi:hypothetical protein GW17_00041065 [Ensete ventricosum]|nr:hypothetical protein GW17_00041065 [Ensete ventricosum]